MPTRNRRRRVPGRNRIPNDLVGATGVHHVCSLLSMRGLIAMPTIRNAKGIDILVTDPATTASASIQVKTSLKNVKYWPTAKPEKLLQGDNFFYVFVRYLPKQNTFQAFIETSRKVVNAVKRNIEDQGRRGRGTFPFWGLPQDENQRRQLEERWANWRPKDR